MVIGNPYNIAVFYEEIKDWNENSEFTNGVLLLFIDGNIFPNEILNVTLGFDLKELSTKLETIPTNKELFTCEMKDCFSKIYNLIYPEDWDEDGDDGYLISPPTYRDYGYYVFAVGDGQKTRFLYAKLKYIMKESQHDLEHAEIREIIVDDDAEKASPICFNTLVLVTNALEQPMLIAKGKNASRCEEKFTVTGNNILGTYHI